MQITWLDYGLVAAAVASAGLTIVARTRWRGRTVLYCVIKPFTTALILLMALLPGTFTTDRYAAAICLALFFSMIGDMLLALPGRFLQGLVSFLLALVCLVGAFIGGLASAAFPLLLAATALVGAAVLRYIWPGLSPGMRLPVSAYVLVMVMMVALAIGRLVQLPSTGTLLAAAGACLFLASDSMLAMDRFRRPLPHVDVAVLGTYYMAQLLIALSVRLLT